MCGIAGLWEHGGGSEAELCSRAMAMAAALLHRGPDDSGVWSDAGAGVALGFRRLAIMDLSQAGAQPMLSASGRYVVVFNGEIFNFERLRAELGPRAYRGHSDTEVLLACIDEWGLERAVSRFIGMFAFAVWDRGERTLSLVRDRFGVKPLSYRVTPHGVSFASELKALEGSEIDRRSLAMYVRYGYVPAPYAILRGARKVLPATILTFAADGTATSRTYWDAPRIAEHAAAHRFTGSEDEAMAAVGELLSDAVRLRMIADVPLGLFLSGGIDSPLIAALMVRETGALSTFTIGFENAPSEAPRAAAIARHLGTRHTEAVIRWSDVLDAVPLMGSIYDEPLGDSSSIPTFLVSRMARPHVTVALSGDGGDELFGGYHRYFLGQRLAERVGRVPRRLRRPLGAALQRAARGPSHNDFRNRLRGLGAALVLDDPMRTFEQEVASDLVRVAGAEPYESTFTCRDAWPSLGEPAELMMYVDAMTFLADDILPKVDRASMAVSLEVREPLLDHRVVELAWSFPLSMKTGTLEGKRILRKLLAQYLPQELVDWKKQGFGLPIDAWLRGPLRDWAASLVNPRRIASEGWFAPATLRRVWNDAPVAGNEVMLWRVLMFQQWNEALSRRR